MIMIGLCLLMTMTYRLIQELIHFSTYIKNIKLVITEDILYIARSRMFTTQEKFLELLSTFQ